MKSLEVFVTSLIDNPLWLGQLSSAGAGLTAELGVVRVLVAEVGADDQVALGEKRLVRALLGCLHLLHLDVDLVGDGLVLVGGPKTTHFS